MIRKSGNRFSEKHDPGLENKKMAPEPDSTLLNRALARIAAQRNASAGISVVVLARKIGNNSF
jgi:hypothetical protein